MSESPLGTILIEDGLNPTHHENGVKSLWVQICLDAKSNLRGDVNNRIRLGYSELLKPTLRMRALLNEIMYKE